MKQYLVRTLFYGIGAGICIPLSVIVNVYFVVLVALILIVFLIVELPRTDSENPEAKSQKRDKIWIFILLALSGVGLYSIYVTIGILFFEGSDSLFIVLLFTGPIALVYSFFAYAVLLRFLNRRSNNRHSNKVAPVESSNGDGLAKFIREIDNMELNKTAEKYCKDGSVFLVKNQFDDAILEFCKVIRISPTQDKWYQSAQAELISMGFSEEDVKQIIKR